MLLRFLDSTRPGRPAGKPCKLSGTQEKLRKDLRRLGLFIELYCDGHHGREDRRTVRLKQFEVTSILGRELKLCPECTRLLAHAFVKRAHCPYDPKPACKHCPSHCYHAAYRAKIREVMRYSGTRFLFRGRLDFLAHLLW